MALPRPLATLRLCGMEIIPPEVLLGAYAEGIFPMVEDDELLWFSPQLRGVIPVDERFHVPRSLQKTLRKIEQKHSYSLRQNTAFREVIEACGEREETWIAPLIVESYCHLFDLGFGHSFEVWDSDGLQGGLYGIRLGGAFFGESMFSRKKDTSKIALVSLVEWMREQGMVLLDTQWMTEHLRQFGGVELPRELYLERLQAALGTDFKVAKQG